MKTDSFKVFHHVLERWFSHTSKELGSDRQHANKKLNTTYVCICNPRLRLEDLELEINLSNTVRETLA